MYRLTKNLNRCSLRPAAWMAALTMAFTGAIASSSHAGTVVSSISTTGSILNSFTAGSTTYTTSQLIQPTMTAFAGTSNLNFIIPSGALPTGAARSELLTHDFDLNSGVINGAAAATSVTLTFSSPLINGPGPDLVVFEIDGAGPPDNFTVIANSTTVAYPGTAYNTDLGSLGTYDAFSRGAGTPTTLSQLQNDPYSFSVSDNQSLFGIVIDLDEFGVPALGSISSLTYGGAGWDPVLFQGINSVPVPEPSSAALLFTAVLGALATGRSRHRHTCSIRSLLPTAWMAAVALAFAGVTTSSHAGTVVSSISTTGSILNSFTAGSTTYTTSQLIQPTMTAFAGSSNTSFITPGSGGLPSGAARSEMLTHDFDLRTGVINGAAGATSVTLTFASPLINGPGPDLVAFEFAVSPGNPDAFSVTANSTTVSYAGTDYNTDLGSVGSFFGYTRNLGTPTTLSQLQNDAYTVAGSPTNQNMFGIVIDLDEFGVPAFGSISSLTYGSGGPTNFWDPVLFQGINSVPVPEPSSAALLFTAVLGAFASRRSRHRQTRNNQS